MIRINLLPKEIQDKGRGADWVIAGCILIVLFAMGGTLSYALKIHTYKKDLIKKERWSRQLAEIRSKVAQVEQLDAQKNLLRAKKDTVLQLFQTRVIYPKFMQAFYDTLPSDVWISDLSVLEDPQKNIKVVATSNALSTEGIADWLSTLEKKPGTYSGITLSAIDARPSADSKSGPTYAFSMSFTYKPDLSGT